MLLYWRMLCFIYNNNGRFIDLAICVCVIFLISLGAYVATIVIHWLRYIGIILKKVSHLSLRLS